MIALHGEHPAQLCWGFVLEVEEQARLKHQPVFAFLSEVARAPVLTVRELFAELTREAGEVVMLGDAYVGDGKIDLAEWAHLRGRIVEMETESKEGRIIP